MMKNINQKMEKHYGTLYPGACVLGLFYNSRCKWWSIQFLGQWSREGWGTYMNVNTGYTFNPTKNISVIPSIDFQKDRFRGNKITGGGLNVTIRF